jgi:CNP1-like family
MREISSSAGRALAPAFWQTAITGCVLTVGLSLAGMSSAHAQGYTDAADWKEVDVPPPPAFDMGKLVTFEVTRGSALTYGVDPASVTISKADSVVRYVMVAYSASGANNVSYDGLRCSTGEVKTYARYTPDGRWEPVADPKWRSVFDITTPKHSQRFARAGACDSSAPVGTVKELVAKLKNPTLKFTD